MKERPILFSGPMVRALLDGRKTQTRRVMKPEHVTRLLTDDQSSGHEFCPCGQLGDRLWVRETWRTAKSLDALSPRKIAKKAEEAGYTEPWAPVEYIADGHRDNWDSIWGAAGKTRVSIHMPRWASRLTLEVTEVRVQRLQDISEEDAKAEGVILLQMDGGSFLPRFEGLWDSINGERPGCSWEANPWVWAISFRRFS